MSVREKGRKKTKQETSTQYKVLADLEHIHLRKGRSSPSKPPPMGTKLGRRLEEKRRKEYLRPEGKGP